MLAIPESSDTSKTPKQGLTRLKVVILLLLVAILIATAAKGIDASIAWALVGIVLLGALVVVLPTTRDAWKDVLSIVKRANIGPVSVEFVEAVVQVADKIGAEPDKDTKKAVDAVALRMSLELKLAYIAKDLLAPVDGGKTYANIGSLEYDGYLTNEQARIATAIASLRHGDLDGLAPSDRDRFLKAARELVGSVRAVVLHHWIEKQLQRQGWQYELVRRNGRQDDFVASKDGRSVRIASVVVNRLDQVQGARERLEPSAGASPGVSKRLIVVPATRHLTSDAEGANPRAVTMTDFKTALGAAP